MRFQKRTMLILAGLCVVTIAAVLTVRRKPRMPAVPPPVRVSVEPAPGRRQAPREIHRREDFLWGKVVDAEGNALAEVTVEAGVFEGESPDSLAQKVFVRSQTTDSWGEFRFQEEDWLSRASEFLASSGTSGEQPSKGLHGLLVASKEGYCAPRYPIDFESASGPHKIVLKTAPEVTGRVIWKETQEPIAGAGVVCTPERRDIYQPHNVESRTGESGNFAITVSAQGQARIGAQLGGYYRYPVRYAAEADIELVPGKRIAGLMLMVERGSDTVIEGRVLDAEGGAVAGARVQLSTNRGASEPTPSREDGQYRLIVPKEWPYQTYFLEDWLGKPEVALIGHGANLLVIPKEVAKERDFWGAIPEDAPNSEVLQQELYWIYLQGRRRGHEKWQWPQHWTPPPHAPPERVVAFHPDYEIGVAEVPFMAVGQIRRGVDIVLYKGSRVSGKVMDDSSEPLVGAKIEIKVLPEASPVLIEKDNGLIRAGEISSGEEGRFEICFLREGSYDLSASHEDCDPTTRRLELGLHQIVEGFDFVLVKRKGFIRGWVFDQKGNPWPDGKVKASTGSSLGYSAKYTAEIMEDGSYELSEMKPDRYNLWLAVRPDYPQPAAILWAEPLRNIPVGTEGANITVTELPAGALRVRVIDQARQPIENFYFQCYPLCPREERSGIFTGVVKGETPVEYHRQFYARFEKYSGVLRLKRDVTSESGQFVTDRLAPGRYSLSVKTDKYRQQFAEVNVQAGGETEVVFSLHELGAGDEQEILRDLDPQERRIRARHIDEEQMTMHFYMLGLEETIANR